MTDSRAGASRALILLYHRVGKLPVDPYNLCVPVESFRGQMEYIARTCNPMSVEELRTLDHRNDSTRRAVAITFDDGYLDAVAAAEILTTLDLPGTFYVNSNQGEETYHDTLSRIFLETDHLPDELILPDDGAGKALSLNCRTSADRLDAFQRVGQYGWSLTHEGRSQLVASLRVWSGVSSTPRDTHRVMSRGELRELSQQRRQAIGAHTANHLFMPGQPHHVKLREIADNATHLSRLVGAPIHSFAYPYGAVDADTTAICRALGFSSAVTVVPELVTTSHDALLLPRYEVTHVDQSAFEAMIESALA